MTSAPLTAESYHLKWDSHSMHLNLSLATLYKHDRFADVMLLSSHPDCLGGPGVPAHKIILSTSSKFFASIFELTPHIPSQNGLMYLVLPPELSRRAIQVLVQYMYSGESTVSNDILKEVLKGGELLKIRGLYRGNSCGSNKNLNITSPIVNANISSSNNINNNSIIQNSSSSPSSNLKNPEIDSLGIKPQSSNKIIVQQKHTKSFPVIISNRPFSLSVKKDIAIDPGSRKNVVLSPICNKIQCTINNNSQNTEAQSLLSVNTESTQLDIVERRKSSIGSNYSDCLLQIKEEPNDDFSEKSQPIMLDETEILSNSNRVETDECQNNETNSSSFMEESCQNEIVIENCDIKIQNPILSEESDENCSLYSDYCDEINIESSSNENVKGTKLQENLTESISYIPKKKRKMESESNTEKKNSLSDNNSNNLEETSGLKCDICLIVFKLPADWVRHMQKHTETELAISNEKLKEDKIRAGSNYSTTKVYMDKLTKACSYCKKSFCSYKEMVAHVRKDHTNTKLK